MEKRTIFMEVSVHWIKAAIIEGLYNNKINLDSDSLRAIAKKIGMKIHSSQIIKHHLEGLVTMGSLDKRAGKYYYRGIKKSNNQHGK